MDGSVLLDEFWTFSASLPANQDPLLAVYAQRYEWLTSQISWRIGGGCDLPKLGKKLGMADEIVEVV